MTFINKGKQTLLAGVPEGYEGAVLAAMAGDALTQPFIPRWSPESTAPGRSWWAPLALPMVRAPLMMLIISWSAMLATWPLLAFNFR